ncbi:hypothetical protein ACCT30_43135 [Rhizobium ruizarguesonis]
MEALEPKFPIFWQSAYPHGIAGIDRGIERVGLLLRYDCSFLHPAKLGETGRLVQPEKIWRIDKGSVCCQGSIEPPRQVVAVPKTGNEGRRQERLELATQFDKDRKEHY